MKMTRRMATLATLMLCMAGITIAQDAWALDVYPTKMEINDHVPATINGDVWKEISKTPYKDSMSQRLTDLTIKHMKKDLKKPAKPGDFKAYLKFDKEGKVTDQVLIVHKDTTRPMVVEWQSDCPVNSQFQQTPSFALDTDTPEADDPFKNSVYHETWGDGIGWEPKFLKPVAAYWARQHHGWVNKYGDKILTKYTARIDSHSVEIVYDKNQVDAYYAALKKANGKPAAGKIGKGAVTTASILGGRADRNELGLLK